MAPQPIITRPGLFTFVSPHSRRLREIIIVASVFILLIIWIDYSYNYAERNSNHIPLTKLRHNLIRDNGKKEKNELVAKKIVANSNIGENELDFKPCVCPTLKPDKVKLTGVVDDGTSDRNLQHKPYDLKMICKNYSDDRNNDRIFPNESLIMENRIVIHKASISCLIIPYSQYDFDLFVKPTWVKKCKNYFAEQREDNLGLSQEKKYLEKLYKKNPEWVVISNCQNFLVMENIQFFLQKFSPSQRLVFQVTDSVFILSNAAIRKAVNKFDSPNCGKANTLFKCLNVSMKIYSLRDSMYEPISIAMRREKSIQSDRMPLLIKNTPPHEMHTIEFIIYNMNLKEIDQSSRMDTLESINSTEDKAETEQINIKSDSVVRPDTEDNKNQIPNSLSLRQKLKRDGNIRKTKKDKGETQEVNIKNDGVIRSDIQDKNRTSLSPGHKSKGDGDSDIRRTEVDIGIAKGNIKPTSDVRSTTGDNKAKTPTSLPPVQHYKPDKGVNIRKTEKSKEDAHVNIKLFRDVLPDTDNKDKIPTSLPPAEKSKPDTGENFRKTEQGKEEAHVNIKPNSDTDDNEVQTSTLHSPAQQAEGDTGANIRKTDEGKEEAHVNSKPDSDVRPDTDYYEDQTPTSLSLVLARQNTKADIHRKHNHQTHVGRHENFQALVLQKAQETIKGIESDNIVRPLSEKKSIEKFKELIEENVSENTKMVPANTLEQRVSFNKTHPNKT